jgi:ribosomal protein S18 acetylase RimI-like enzyme
MIVKLTETLQIKLRRPIAFLAKRKYELTFHLPVGTSSPPVSLPDGYCLKEFKEPDKDALLSLFKKCGFDFSTARIDEALSICLPGGLFLIVHSDSRALVSTMMARHLSSPEFPFGGRIDWLATDPDHCGKGFGRLSASLATNHLIKLGYQNIWVTTQPHRLAAVRIFTSIGFIPTSQTLSEYDWKKIQKKIKLRQS